MTPARALLRGLLLTAAAGMIDVVGFIELGGFYTSFMSGNTTQLGAAFAGLSGTTLLLPAGLILCFFLGSFAGAWLAGTRNGPVAVAGFALGGVLLTLALVLAGVAIPFAMLLLTLAAGAQNSMLVQQGAARLGATFITGTLLAAGQDLARAVRGEAPPLRWLQHLLVWLSLLAGALAGALAYSVGQIWSLLIPAAIYAAFLGTRLILQTTKSAAP